MLKKLQSLKAKKGFTLVELIVVIAIIAVLAAILVPTMLGYVTSSRVTSANTTAASIKNNIDGFLTTADTQGYGMLLGSTVNQKLVITVDSAKWSITAATKENFKSGSTIKWGTAAASKTKDDKKSEAKSAEDLLAIELANLFPEVKTAESASVLRIRLMQIMQRILQTRNILKFLMKQELPEQWHLIQLVNGTKKQRAFLRKVIS